MIQPPREIVEVTSNGMPLNVIPLGVKTSGIRHLRDIVSNRIYSDKVLAPIREYSTNAADAHAAKGISDRPILITLPNTLAPSFGVRDYGHGMSEFQIADTFANYGESTKRNTNNQVGMFGIGSKSAFAYGVVSFMVISYQSGIKYTYMVSSIGGPEDDGGIFPIGKEQTTEEDGLEIQIPVKSDDIGQFVTKAAQFFQHWSVMPIFQGNSIDITVIKKQFAGNDWYMSANSNDSSQCHVLMGNITYRVEEAGLGLTYENDDYYLVKSLIRESNLIISFPIGSVDFSASRETLEYTPRTKEAVLAKLNGISGELAQLIKSKVDAIPTTFAKYCYASKMLEFDSPFYKIWKFLKDKVSLPTNYKFDGRSLVSMMTVDSYSRSRKGNRRFKLENNKWGVDYIECRESVAYILNDGVKNINHRVIPIGELDNNALGKKYSKVIVFTIKDKASFDKWATDNNFDIPWVLASTLPAIKPKELYPNSYVGNSTYVKSSVAGVKILTLKLRGGQHGYFSVEPVVFPTDGSRIPYIEIDRYMVKRNSSSTYSNFCEADKFVNGLHFISTAVGVDVATLFPTIVAVRTADVKKLNVAKYIPFSEWFTQTFDSNAVYTDKMCDANFNSFKSFNSPVIRTVVKRLKDITNWNLVTRDETKQFLNSCEFLFSKSGDRKGVEEFQSLFVSDNLNYLKAARNREDTTLVKCEEFSKRYPILNMLSESTICYQDPADDIKLVQYINFVDCHCLTVDKTQVSV